MGFEIDGSSARRIVDTPLGDIVMIYDDRSDKLLIEFEADEHIRSKCLVMNDGRPTIEVSRVREAE